MDTDNFDRGKISLSRIPSIRPKKNSIGHQKSTEKHNKHYPTQVQFEVSLRIIIHYGRYNLQVTADILGAWEQKLGARGHWALLEHSPDKKYM